MKRLFSVFLVLLFLLVMIAPASIEAEAAPIDRYGYSLLKTDIQRSVYNAMVSGVSALTPTIEVSVSGITSENINAVVEDIKFAATMMYRDYPEFYWFDGGTGIKVTGNTVALTPAGYKVDGKAVTAGSSELAEADRKFKTALNKAMAKINPNMSHYEIAHTFHDYLIDVITYEMSGDHQTAYGALVSGKAVCAGYTRAYQLLMNQAGLPCWYVSGKSYAPNGQLFGHAWNLVWLDGMCYYTDVTWDDQMKELFHEYLNLSKEEISRTHFTDDPLPARCGHDTYTFFIRNDGKGVCDFHGHKNDKEIAQCFELRSKDAQTAAYYCTIHYHGNDFKDWFNQHKVGIIKELGLTGAVQCQIIELGYEHHVTLTGNVKSQPQTQPETQAPVVEQEPTQAATQAPTQPKEEEPVQTPTEAPIQTPEDTATEGSTEAAT